LAVVGNRKQTKQNQQTVTKDNWYALLYISFLSFYETLFDFPFPLFNNLNFN
jgi:hypothetical protein